MEYAFGCVACRGPASIARTHRRSAACHDPLPPEARYDGRHAASMGHRMPIISVRNLSKTYASGFEALRNVDLDIRRGEILALLGPNGAGKTTLISIICGIVNASSGTATVDGHDIVR